MVQKNKQVQTTGISKVFTSRREVYKQGCVAGRNGRSAFAYGDAIEDNIDIRFRNIEFITS